MKQYLNAGLGGVLKCVGLVFLMVLFGAGCETEKERKEKETLFDAVEKGDVSKMKELLNKGANLDAKNKVGRTALCEAIQRHQTEIPKFLVESGADVNVRCWNGRTPLRAAIDEGNLEIAQLLIEKGADINAEDNDGKTPLHWAASGTYATGFVTKKDQEDDLRTGRWLFKDRKRLWGRWKIALLLLKKGADINAKDNDGKTPLAIARRNRSTEIQQALLAKGAK